jgi:hypothetical protein
LLGVAFGANPIGLAKEEQKDERSMRLTREGQTGEGNADAIGEVDQRKLNDRV